MTYAAADHHDRIRTYVGALTGAELGDFSGTGDSHERPDGQVGKKSNDQGRGCRRRRRIGNRLEKVLNNHPQVKEGIKKRVIHAIGHLNYKPDLVARSMRATASKTLAFVVRDFRGPTLGALADAVQKEADAAGFSLYVASSYHDPKREVAFDSELQGASG